MRVVDAAPDSSDHQWSPHPMKNFLKLGTTLILISSFSLPHGWAEEEKPRPHPLPGLAEATMRARLLHTSMEGVLTVMHRDFFRKGESRAIPSKSLEDVFKAMEAQWGVQLRWLASDATAMNVEHEPKDDFQKAALQKITAGEREVVQAGPEVMRFAGAIVLRNECLKCHVQGRTTLEDRFAALEIRIPFKP